MTSIRKVDNIIVTYYVDPHHFYFKYKEDPIGDDKLTAINSKIEKYVSRHVDKRQNPHSPEIGEIVLCRYISDCVYKWMRARVDTKLTYANAYPMFILWAIDYGFPIESESRWIRPLISDELKVIEKGLIFKGGLFEIVPCAVEWNFVKSAEELRKMKKWSPRAVDSVEKYLHEADGLTFKCRAFFDDHFFGSLVIQSNTGSKLTVVDFLKSLKEGVESLNFLKDFSRLDNPPYWLRQGQGALYKIYENNSDRHPASMDQTTIWMSTDDPLNKNKSDMPELLKINDGNNCEADQTMINLSQQFDSAATLSVRSVQMSSNSLKIHRAAKYDKDGRNDAPVSNIPMKNRLAMAQEKIVQRDKVSARKHAQIAETNKHMMDMSFPAGYIVDTKAIQEKYKYLEKQAAANGGSRYQTAKEDEYCCSVSHADRILVHDHGNNPVKRINDVHDADFPQEVHAALKNLNINQTFRIQTIGWPGLLRGLSMILVNNARTGKTWTYLPAVCTSIIERIGDNRVVDGCGPLSIIACASLQDVNEITERLEHLLRNTDPHIKCFKAYGFSDGENVMSQLLNGDQILVTTVPCLYRLMVDPLNLFSKERIVHLVFDNIDLVYEQFRREIDEVYKALCGSTSDVQLIVTSRMWIKVLERFYTESDRVTLCIGSYLEAAVYAKIDMTIQLLGQKQKIDKLMTYIKDLDYRHALTLVIGSTPEDVEELVQKLQSVSMQIWYYHDQSDSSEINSIKKLIANCRPGNFRVLICTDEVLRDLDIRCARHIVHFTLPSSWTMFGFRFSTLFDNHENLLTRKNGLEPVTSVVFVDEDNNEQIPRLVDFMKMRGNCVIPEQVLKLAESKRIEKEEQQCNIYKRFCDNLITIGVCHGQFTCSKRHILTKFDRSRSEIPQNGYVKFVIIAVHSPVHFTVRLMEHRLSCDINWTKLQHSDKVALFNMELQKYFHDDENQVAHLPVALGDLCAVCVESGGDKYYARGQIVKIEEKRFLAVTTQYLVDVLLIDSNDRMQCFSTALMRLPDKLKTFPYQAVDVHIADIVPRDLDNEWDPSILSLVKKWVHPEHHHYCQALIKLSVMNTLWVESVEVIELLRSINEEVKTVSIKRNLLARNLCVRHSKPLQLMMGLAESAGLNATQDSGCPGLTPTQIVDRSASVELKVFKNNSDEEDFDVDVSNGSNASLHKWSSDDEDGTFKDALLINKIKTSSSKHEENLLSVSQDRWAELTPHQFNKVVLCNFFHPNRIYIRNSYYSSRFADLNKRIERFTAIQDNLTQLPSITLAVNCLAKIGNAFGRAKIMKVFHNTDGITAEVFYVDLGEFLVLPANELFEVPEEIVKALPFQAIFCHLIGIRPIDSPMWSDTICDHVYDELLVEQAHFYVRSMQLGGPDKYAYGLKSRSYRVVLLDRSGDVNINQWIVSRQYGEFDPETEHLVDIVYDRNVLTMLESDRSDDDDSDAEYVDCKTDLLHVDDDKFDIQFDDDDINKLLLANGISIPFKDLLEQLPLEVREGNGENSSNNLVEQVPAQIEEINEIREEKSLTSVVVAGTRTEKSSPIENKSPVANDAIGTNAKGPTGLTSLHKFPKIKWHQSESVVVLTVHAPDVPDYFLKVTSRMVKLCFICNGEKFAAVLNLFGCVDVQYISHEIRGLNITIRLVKLVCRLMWPRLVQAMEKNQFLQYDFEANKDSKFVSGDDVNAAPVIRQEDGLSSSASSVHDDDDYDGIDIDDKIDSEL